MIEKILKRNGIIIEHSFYNDKNELHNPNGFSQIRRFHDGVISTLFYHIDGSLHNRNGVAATFYYNNGQVSSETYAINGIKQNMSINGVLHAAITYFDEDGSINMARFISNNEQDELMIDHKLHNVDYKIDGLMCDENKYYSRYKRVTVSNNLSTVYGRNCEKCGEYNDYALVDNNSYVCWGCENK